jgi:tRNA U34 5-carboxymethylaminomethyl modifying enzyme MnmG/GidA
MSNSKPQRSIEQSSKQPIQHSKDQPNQISNAPKRGLGHRYDVLIVGAGVAGCEAAWRCQAAGLDTLLITTSLDTVYNLLGDAVKLEPPAGSLMQRVFADVQQNGYASNWAFHRRAKTLIEQETDIHLLQSSVMALLYEDVGIHEDAGAASLKTASPKLVSSETVSSEPISPEPISSKPGLTHKALTTNKLIKGVQTWEGIDRFAAQVALCVGSFLGARLTIGTLIEVAGRLSEMAYDDLFEDLTATGFSFEQTQLKADFQDGSLPYEVMCHAFAAHEQAGYTLKQARGLYAAGVCRQGYIPFEQAALEGQHLADVLIQQHQQS